MPTVTTFRRLRTSVLVASLVMLGNGGQHAAGTESAAGGPPGVPVGRRPAEIRSCRLCRRSERKLDGYVLAPYLDDAGLQRDLRTLDAGTARRFLAAEATTQLGSQFRGEYLQELARRGDWPGFLAFDDPTTATTSPPPLCPRCGRCWPPARNKAARAELEQVWPTGQSLPDACDEPIATARRRGWLSAELVWQRLRLAVEAGNTGLASYLLPLLPEDQRADAERLTRALANPAATLEAAARWPDRAPHREAVRHALQRQARADVASAIGNWQRLAPRFSFTAEDRDRRSCSRSPFTRRSPTGRMRRAGSSRCRWQAAPNS